MTTTVNLQTSQRAALVSASVDKPIAIRLGQQELDEVLQLARAEDRPAGNFARMVACRRVAATAADLSGAQHDERQHRPQHRLEPVTADLQALSLYGAAGFDVGALLLTLTSRAPCAPMSPSGS